MVVAVPGVNEPVPIVTVETPDELGAPVAMLVLPAIPMAIAVLPPRTPTVLLVGQTTAAVRTVPWQTVVVPPAVTPELMMGDSGVGFTVTTNVVGTGLLQPTELRHTNVYVVEVTTEVPNAYAPKLLFAPL